MITLNLNSDAPLLPRALAVLCAFATLSPSVHATQGDKNQLEHIVVNAQKSPQNLQEVPVAVTAMSGDSLVEAVIKDVFDLQNYVPSFAAFQNQSVTNSGFSIRGIGTSSQNFGFESSVGLYVDGVYRSRQNALINDLVDIASVEILRGPQGTLFGKNTAAGAMTVSSVAPSFEETDGFVEVLAGNDELLRLSGAASFVVLDDILAMRISGFSSRAEGFIEDTHSGKTLNNKNRSAVKVQWLYTPSDTLSLRVVADYGELDERCCGALTWQSNLQANGVPVKFGTDSLLQAPPFNATLYSRDNFFQYTTSLSQVPTSKMTDKGISAQLDIKFNDVWSLVSISAFRAFDSFDIIDSDFSDANLLTAENDARQQSFSQEIRAHYKSKSMRAIFGAYYFTQNLDLDFNTTTQEDFSSFFTIAAADLLPLADAIDGLSQATAGAIAPAGVLAPSNTAFYHSAYQEQDSIALFTQADWRLNGKTTLTTGLRYTIEDKDILGQYGEQGPGIDGLAKNSQEWPNVSKALAGLQQIGTALAAGDAPSDSALAAISPFQSDGWGYYFLGAATVLPRDDLMATFSDNQLTGTVKLAYRPSETTMLYSSLATGYKAGGTNTDRISPQFDAVFDAEKARSAEIGVKQEWRELGLRMNLAAHYTQISDFQATTFDGTGFNLQNAGDIDVKGIEVDANWYMTVTTELAFSAARTLANFKTFKKGTCWVAYTWHTEDDDPGRATPEDPFCARDGDRVGFEPQNSAALTVTQYFTLSDIDGWVSVDYQYTGNVYLDDTNDPYKRSPAYQIVNARLNLYFADLDSHLTFWARNLFDEEYVARSGFDVPVQQGKIMAYPGAPRSYGVTVRKRF